MRLLIVTAMCVLGSFGVHAQERNITNPNKAKGEASYYHDKFEGRQTSTGEIFDNDKFTAASNTLKLGSYVKVTNLSNGEVCYVRINDRMNKSNTRVIDLASIAAKKLHFHKNGVTDVKVEIVPENEGKNAILAQREMGSQKPNRL